jgi:hypothetical protein
MDKYNTRNEEGLDGCRCNHLESSGMSGGDSGKQDDRGCACPSQSEHVSILLVLGEVASFVADSRRLCFTGCYFGMR